VEEKDHAEHDPYDQGGVVFEPTRPSSDHGVILSGAAEGFKHELRRKSLRAKFLPAQRFSMLPNVTKKLFHFRRAYYLQ
jgi:hypothetical protein